jgi:nitrate/TMAO reductase-like tetraheme cytochrome c subunit
MSVFVDGLIVFLLLALGLGFLFWAAVGRLAGKEFKLTRRAFIYSLAIPAVLVMVFGAMGWFLEWHEEPEFCGEMCHSMEPLYEAYENPRNNTMMATHLEVGVGCTGCHVGPGWWGQVEAYLAVPHEFYSEIFNTYDPHDLGGGLKEESCLKCHDGDVASEPGLVLSALKTMVDPHTSDEDCADCHQAHQGARGLTIEACNVCHGLANPDFGAAVEAHGVRAGEECMDCHDRHHPDDATVPFSRVVNLTDDFCADCHMVEVQVHLESSTEASLALYGNCTTACHLEHNRSHAYHVEYEPYDNCSDCHTNLDGPGGFHNRTGVDYADFPSFVDNDLCYDCHLDAEEGLDQKKNHRGLECVYCHAQHAQRSIVLDECTICHTEIPDWHSGDSDCTRSSCHGKEWYH